MNIFLFKLEKYGQYLCDILWEDNILGMRGCEETEGDTFRAC